MAEKREQLVETYPINDLQMVAPYQIFPDPVETYFIVRSAISMDEQIDLSIFSYEGLLFKKFESVRPDENYEYVVDVRNLPPGNYYLMIQSVRGYKIERMNKK